MDKSGPQAWQIAAKERRLAVAAALAQRRNRMRERLDELYENIGQAIGEILGRFQKPDIAINTLQALLDNLEDEHTARDVPDEETERTLAQLRLLVEELDTIDTALLQESEESPNPIP